VVLVSFCKKVTGCEDRVSEAGNRWTLWRESLLGLGLRFK